MKLETLKAIESVATAVATVESAYADARKKVDGQYDLRKIAVLTDAAKDANETIRNEFFAHYLSGDKPYESALKDAYLPTITVTFVEKNDKLEVSYGKGEKRFNVFDMCKADSSDTSVIENALESCRKAVCGYWVAQFATPNNVNAFLDEFDSINTDKCGADDLKDRYTLGNIDRNLQKLMDVVAYNDATNGGKNGYVFRKDYRNKVIATVTGLDKKIGSVKFVNSAKFGEIVTSMMAAIVNGVTGAYKYSK